VLSISRCYSCSVRCNAILGIGIGYMKGVVMWCFIHWLNGRIVLSPNDMEEQGLEECDALIGTEGYSLAVSEMITYLVRRGDISADEVVAAAMK